MFKCKILRSAIIISCFVFPGLTVSNSAQLPMNFDTMSANDIKKGGLVKMCDGVFALCEATECKYKPGDNYATCKCHLQNGKNIGPTACDNKLRKLSKIPTNRTSFEVMSTYSPKHTGSTIVCSQKHGANKEYARCYGAKCVVTKDSKGFNHTHCSCPIIKTGRDYVAMSFDCEKKDHSICNKKNTLVNGAHAGLIAAAIPNNEVASCHSED